MKKEISIIIPTHHDASSIVKCLNSLLNQNINNYKIIVIDDGSTDDTFNIVNKFAINYPQKVKLFRQPNYGVSAARNKGLDEVTIEYVTFVDADDYVDSDYLSVLLKPFDRDNNIDMTICGYQKESIDYQKIYNGNYDEVGLLNQKQVYN